MKVGFVIDDHMARPGGVQEYVRGLYHYLRAHGHEAVIFSSAGGQPQADLRLIPLGAALPLSGSGSSTSIPITLAAPARLRQLLAREACDVLHVMAPYSPTLSGRLLVQSRTAHVLTFLVAIEPGPYRSLLGLLARLQRRSLRRFHARIAISETAAETAQALYGGHYDLVPCGVDTDRFTPDVAPLPSLRDGCVNLLYLGRLEQRKGVAHLVRAFARLQRQYPNLRLVIGGDGPERATLGRLVQEHALERVVFLGYVPSADLPRLFASADLFCAPATYAESFGIVLIEAMAAGLPIVAAANAGYAGLLAAHPGNLLAPPGDDRALAGAIASLVEHPAYAQSVGARNRAAAERYNWRTVGQAVLDVYERVRAERRRFDRAI
ncbi:MAG TPA: glycosyltransferase family 4 protein [Herpetosiphonaceae bacterium]